MKKLIIIALFIPLGLFAQWQDQSPPLNSVASFKTIIDNLEDDIWLFADNVGPFHFNSLDSSWIPKSEGLHELVNSEGFFSSLDASQLLVNSFGTMVMINGRLPLFYDGDKWIKVVDGLPRDSLFNKQIFKFKSDVYLINGNLSNSWVYKYAPSERKWDLFKMNNFPFPEEIKSGENWVVFENKNTVYWSTDLVNFEISESTPIDGNEVAGFVSDGESLFQIMIFQGFFPNIYELKRGSTLWERKSEDPTTGYRELTLIDSTFFVMRAENQEPLQWKLSFSQNSSLNWDSISISSLPGHFIAGGISYNDSSIIFIVYGIGPVIYNKKSREFNQITKNINAAYHSFIETDRVGNLYTYSYPLGLNVLRKGRIEWEAIKFPFNHLISNMDFKAEDSLIWVRIAYSPYHDIDLEHYVSSDNGVTWRKLDISFINDFRKKRFEFSGQIGDSLYFYDPVDQDIYLSKDKAVSFEIDSTFFPIKYKYGFEIVKWKNQYFSNGFAGEGFVFRLENGSWKEYTQNLSSFLSIGSLISNEAYLIFKSTDSVYRNSDDGNGWVSYPLKESSLKLKGIGDSLIFALDYSRYHVFLSRDFGESFKKLDQGLSLFYRATDITITDDGTLWLSTFNDGLYSGKLEGIATQVSKNEIEQNILIYPNPTNGLFSIQLSEDNNTGVFKIYNLNGALVRSEEVAGETLIQLDINNHPKGIYFLTFSNEKGSVSAKIIKN
ncbi:MAG: hypothetical protein ACJATA_000370 [Sphingobacteriales bacterium]|jgi:hypothetical protein